MINAGIKAIVYGGIGSACVDEMTKRVIHDLLRGRRGFVMRQVTGDPAELLDPLPHISGCALPSPPNFLSIPQKLTKGLHEVQAFHPRGALALWLPAH